MPIPRACDAFQTTWVKWPGVRLKPRLCEGRAIDFAYDARRPRLEAGVDYGGPKQGEVLPHLRMVAVHKPVGPCQLRRMALGRGIERRAQDEVPT